MFKYIYFLIILVNVSIASKRTLKQLVNYIYRYFRCDECVCRTGPDRRLINVNDVNCQRWRRWRLEAIKYGDNSGAAWVGLVIEGRQRCYQTTLTQTQCLDYVTNYIEQYRNHCYVRVEAYATENVIETIKIFKALENDFFYLYLHVLQFF